MGEIIVQVDAFTDRPFGGNPAGVCLLDGPKAASWMQRIAREMNLSETAFLYPEDKGYRLRWFTPKVEVDLCGHATLASAHVLWETDQLGPNDTVVFHTLSGVLKARANGREIELDFPRVDCELVDAPDGLEEVLGVNSVQVYASPTFYLVKVEEEKDVRELAPDFSGMKRISPDRAVIVTSVADAEEFDFISRCFHPSIGIDEDPVTGSAHCLLGPFWQERLDKDELKAYQASQRGGSLRVRVEGDRVYLAGQAISVMRIELLVG